MSVVTLKKIRNLRSKGKKQLIVINERLNSLAWELSSSNESVNDPNITKAINTMDEALETLQVAMVLLNTVSVDAGLLEEKPVAAKAEKAPRKPMFGKKTASKPVASKAVPSKEIPGIESPS